MARLLVVAFSMILSMAALAQQGQPPGGQGQMDPQKFQDAKKRILERIDRRIGEAQKTRGCVQQAQDQQALHACRPEGGGNQRGGK